MGVMGNRKEDYSVSSRLGIAFCASQRLCVWTEKGLKTIDNHTLGYKRKA
jgi:hypothetical protein